MLSQTKVCPAGVCGSAAVTLSTTANTYQANGACTSGTPAGPPYAIFLCSTVQTGNDADGTPLPKVETDYANYDADGNVGTVTVSTTPGSGGSADLIKQTVNTYADFIDSTHWCLGRVTAATATSTWLGTSKTRSTSFDYDTHAGAASTCLLTKSIVEPGLVNSPLWTETDYQYDAYGNKISVSIRGCAVSTVSCTPVTRTATSVYYNAHIRTLRRSFRSPCN